MGRNHAKPHVAVCVDSSTSYGRRVLRGVARYQETTEAWSLYVNARTAGTYDRDWLTRWHGDGVLLYIEDRRFAERVRRSGIPAVEVFGHHADLGLRQVANDEAAIGRVAAEHLLERHLADFAFVGYSGELWSERRRDAYAATARQAGQRFHGEFPVPRAGERLRDWERNQDRLAAWLKGLPGSLGVMACSDRQALRVLDACTRAGLGVPDQVAVIGVDNDEEICRLASPPLSSVIDDAERIGFEGAALLGRLMARKSHGLTRDPLLIAPLGVAVRHSTDVLAINDAVVANAVRSIRTRACSGLRIDELVDESGVSRTLFFRRFRQSLGRTPCAEMRRVQIERVRALLLQSDLSLEQIAALTGFEHPEYLNVLFRREMGEPPGAFRRRARHAKPRARSVGQ
jgi:LacI family transcriptional regulator